VEILETVCTDEAFALRSPNAIHLLLPGEDWDIGVGKNGAQANKIGNVSKMRKDRGKFTM